MNGDLISKLVQVCLVTAEFEATVASLAENLGIGPWKCWHYRPPSLLDTRLQGAPAPWTMKLGVAWVGEVQLEVIQPVSGDTIYRDYLKTQGEGAQHLLVGTGPGYFESIRAFEDAGYARLQGASINPPMQVGALTLPPLPGLLAGRFATQFVYLDTRQALGTVLEISKMPPGVPFRAGVRLGKPDFWIPAGSRDLESDLPNRLIESITRVGLIVPDLEAAARGWEALGVGPWHWETGEALKMARTRLAPVTLELVQPEGPSAYQKILEEHGSGIGYLGVRMAPGGSTKIRTLGARMLKESEQGALYDAQNIARTALFVE